MKLILEIKCSKFPMAHQMLGVSLIKKALEQSSKEYFNALYVYKGERINKRSKDFCFATRVYDYELSENEFVVKDKVVICISTPNQELMIHLYNGLLNCREFQYKLYELKIQKIYMKQHTAIKRPTAIFKTQSPIWIKGADNQSIEIEDDRYVQELNYICDNILLGYRGYGLQQELLFEPVDMRKKVVKQEIREFIELENKPFYYNNCYEGILKLTGHIQDLNDLSQLGIGFRRNQGFGMIELL